MAKLKMILYFLTAYFTFTFGHVNVLSRKSLSNLHSRNFSDGTQINARVDVAEIPFLPKLIPVKDGRSFLLGPPSSCPEFHPLTNSKVQCKSKWKENQCEIKCFDGYQMDTAVGAETCLTFVCKNGSWIEKDRGILRPEKCNPICDPPCANEGVCVLPNTCDCPPNYYGPCCETKNILCPEPPMPNFSTRQCNEKKCIVTCVPGKIFPDGSTSVEMFCNDGKWKLSKQNLDTLPDCQAVCDPPCLNRGKCIETNVCMCPTQFRGPKCQYSVDQCDPSKLNFNGMYNCTGDDDVFSCHLWCPPTTNPLTPFAPVYNCLFSEGVYKPNIIPQCNFGSAKIIRKEFSTTLISSSRSASCMLWNSQVKMLSDKILNFRSNCAFTVLEDDVDHLFHIQAAFHDGTIEKITIFINNMEYVLAKKADGKPSLVVSTTGQPLSIPCQLTDLKVEIASGNSIAIYLPAIDTYLVWNLQDELQIDTSEKFSNRTSGLCGKKTSVITGSWQSHVSSSVVRSLADKCETEIEPAYTPSENEIYAAKIISKQFLLQSLFQRYLKKLPAAQFAEALEWSYLQCTKPNRQECVCQFYAKFVQHCNRVIGDVQIDWREKLNCTVKCPPNEVYTSCVPISQTTCTSQEVAPTVLRKYCQEGCVCSPDKVLHESKCISRDVCPCIYGGKFYEPDSVIPKDCNKCTCSGGKWICTDEVCRAECLVFGDPHYRTFDGKKFDFSGSCTYKLVVTDDVTIETVNGICSKCSKTKMPTTKTVIIHVGKKVIYLKDQLRVFIDREEIEHLPIVVNGSTYIRKASSLVLQVILPNGLEVLWNGKSKLQVFANSSLFDKTKGLCGTFNKNQQDDMLTPENDIEKSITAFANKWRSNEKCEAEKLQYDGSNACEIFVQNKAIAEMYCKNLTSSTFEDCHSIIDPRAYFEDCLNDMCSCREENPSDCLCPILSAYAQECARVGIILDWRSNVRSCGIHCTNGQKYDACGPSCQRSCADISHGELCRGSCTEGCYCPSGQALNENDDCIPIKSCPCFQHEREYPAGYVDIRNQTEAWECKNALWERKIVTEEEFQNLQKKFYCDSPNEEYVDCEPAEPTTCRNMHDPPKYSSKTCLGGCVCKEGFVWEPITKECIKPADCPCHHGGRSYADRETIKEDCNNCTCTKGKWQCTTYDCNAVCSTWGDSHFKTFDGRYYDFQGTCNYMFAQGRHSDIGLFSVAIEVVPCGTGGTSCTQSLTVTAGNNIETETVSLSPKKTSALKKKYKKFEILLTGLNVIVVFKDYSIVLFWDKSTRVTLQVDPKWKSKVTGLCGDYNGNAEDDFQSPSGGLVEALPDVFADSWKLQQHCPFPGRNQNPCVLHPQRKFWSVLKCSMLKDSPIFQKCHAQVPVEDFFNRCVFDACACDQGGDCECLCTSFAAYAQECSAKGVTLKWRRQDLCPIQCESGTKYSPCISSCPEKSCNNLYDTDTSCKKIACVEGCEKLSCPHQTVRLNSTSSECGSPKECLCMVINGTVFKEHQETIKDDCHSCICTGGKERCTGMPCAPSTNHSISESFLTPYSKGWSHWASIDRNELTILRKNNIIFMSQSSEIICPPQDMKDVKCQAFTSFVSEAIPFECSFDSELNYPENSTDLQIKIQCEYVPAPDIESTIPSESSSSFSYSWESSSSSSSSWESTSPSAVLPTTTMPECSMRCGDVCHYFLKQLQLQDICQSTEDCVDDIVNTTCHGGLKLRDSVCVKAEDCTCMSKNESLVRPSVFIKEAIDCSICQCLNNMYDCSIGKCVYPVLPQPKIIHQKQDIEEQEPTPPPAEPLPECSSRKLGPIDRNAKYRASSNFIGSQPVFARLETSGGRLKNTRAWKAEDFDPGHYLDVDLGSRLPVYGIEIAGCPDKYEFVKSFRLLYSTDNVTFYSAHATSGSKIFGGCYDPKIPQKQMLKNAVEARYLRVKPVTWQNGVTMLIKVLGCRSRTPPPKRCKERLGIESGQLLPHQVVVSSKLNDDFQSHDLSINSPSGWAPFIASANEYVEFNFYDERTVEGIITKGANIPILDRESWIEAYKVRYSVDGKRWMKILDQGDEENIFSANFDNFSPSMNNFAVPIKANLLRFYPVKWNHYPTLRIELMGCFKPYDKVPPPPPPLPVNVCDGVKVGSKKCHDQLYWNGTDCVDKEFCPCVAGLFVHEVGTVFFKDSCTKCTCSLGGIASCSEVTADCSSCTTRSMLYSVNEKCGCECAPCPNGTKLCPTSNVCIEGSLWCDGKLDCADDENEHICVDEEPTSPTSPPTTPPSTTPEPPRFCPISSCAEVYTVHVKAETTKSDSKSRFFRAEHTVRNVVITETLGSVTNTSVVAHVRQVSASAKQYKELLAKQSAEFDSLSVYCETWECVPGPTCPQKPRCTFGTKIHLLSMEGGCPAYECVPLPPDERECHVDGPSVFTFDGLHYTYEMCDHVLAQDQFQNWRVRKLNKCTNGICDASIIITHFNDEIQFFTNFSLLFNGYVYTIPQLRAIGAKSDFFTVKSISNKFVIFSSFDLRFSVIWSSLGSTRIVIDAGLHHMIDGLCGHFDLDPANDKMKPDGSTTSFSEEFGNSWSFGNETCSINVCPEDVQKKAREICQRLKKSPFDVCDFTLDVEAEITKCVASICTCAAHNKNFEKECRCSALEAFALKCSNQQPGSDLSLWRMKHDCAINCTAPLVYHDCYERRCEPGCSSLLDSEECQRVENRCFSGCYCPSGLIREGDTCIKSTECRDAECSVNVLSNLNAFDHTAIQFDQNSCNSYILLQTKITETLESELKIVVSKIRCGFGKESFNCLGMLSIYVDAKEIKLYQIENDMTVKIGKEIVTSFPYDDGVIKLTRAQGVSVTVSLPSLMLDIIYKEDFKGFSIKLPSYMYAESLSGLCGTLNRNQSQNVIDVSSSQNSKLTNPLTRWETSEPPESLATCIAHPPSMALKNCTALKNDICQLLFDVKVFGRCNAIVDPTPYVAVCRETICGEGNYCNSFAAYADECYQKGLCIPWRNVNRCPYNCPAGTEYHACGSSCELTCDNYEVLENGGSCSSPFMERCGCLEGQVLLNGTCVEAIKCKPCDKFNHYAGSVWKPDSCTECECNKNRNIICHKKECLSDITCPLGTQKMIDKNNDDPCCEKYICETSNISLCPPLIQIDCGKFQERQLTTLPNNCSQYICSCIPKETCPELEDDDSELLPGMVRKLKTDCCCPMYELECVTSSCPLPEECRKFEKLVETKKPSHCCPHYECVPPPMSCIYDYQWIVDSNRTDRRRLSSEAHTELKKVGETWLDGICHECVCRNETKQGICSQIRCAAEPENNKYVMKAVHYPEQCCPEYETVACKVGEKILAVNQSIHMENEPCKTILCIQNELTGEISREETVERCKKDCELGWMYQESSNSSVCCGSCKQTSCVDGTGMVRSPGSEWYSSDNCTKYECNSEIKIIGYMETCPNIESCPKMAIYSDGCCQRCKFEAKDLRKCAVQPLKLNDTLGIIKKQLPDNGTCTNKKPVIGLNICDGECSGDPVYDSDTFQVFSPCGCCTGFKFKSQTVILTCERGEPISLNIEIPIECTCEGCGVTKKQSSSHPFPISKSES